MLDEGPAMTAALDHQQQQGWTQAVALGLTSQQHAVGTAGSSPADVATHPAPGMPTSTTTTSAGVRTSKRSRRANSLGSDFVSTFAATVPGKPVTGALTSGALPSGGVQVGCRPSSDHGSGLPHRQSRRTSGTLVEAHAPVNNNVCGQDIPRPPCVPKVSAPSKDANQGWPTQDRPQSSILHPDTWTSLVELGIDSPNLRGTMSKLFMETPLQRSRVAAHGGNSACCIATPTLLVFGSGAKSGELTLGPQTGSAAARRGTIESAGRGRPEISLLGDCEQEEQQNAAAGGRVQKKSERTRAVARALAPRTAAHDHQRGKVEETTSVNTRASSLRSSASFSAWTAISESGATLEDARGVAGRATKATGGDANFRMKVCEESWVDGVSAKEAVAHHAALRALKNPPPLSLPHGE